jgi:hypothetical protein
LAHFPYGCLFLKTQQQQQQFQQYINKVAPQQRQRQALCVSVSTFLISLHLASSERAIDRKGIEEDKDMQ